MNIKNDGIQRPSRKAAQQMPSELDRAACTPAPIKLNCFNEHALLPHGLTLSNIQNAMNDFISFVGFVNEELLFKEIDRLENILMPASFSTVVGEYIVSAIPKHCHFLVKNRFHNGHPDLIPKDKYPGNRQDRAPDGIEIKASRRADKWEGHNCENVWLIGFRFECNSMNDDLTSVPPKPFRFLGVLGAQLTLSDWKQYKRKGKSKRTPTASVLKSGLDKMRANWIYRDC